MSLTILPDRQVRPSFSSLKPREQSQTLVIISPEYIGIQTCSHPPFMNAQGPKNKGFCEDSQL
jgi:hypothetical protein